VDGVEIEDSSSLGHEQLSGRTWSVRDSPISANTRPRQLGRGGGVLGVCVYWVCVYTCIHTLSYLLTRKKEKHFLA